MFYLYQSNRLESLAALFSRIHRVQPLAQPLAAEEIIVQSQGMRRYLSSYLAKELGVAANLKFRLPGGLQWDLMRALIPDVPVMSPFSPEVMRWRLLALFRSKEFQTASAFETVRAKLQSYLGSGESADYQLAGQLADIFDQYLVYRPQWIDAWQAGKLLDLGEDESWQAQLWQFLDDGRQSAPHRVALWEQLLAALRPEALPQRLFVFGISTMAPMYLQLLQAISQHCDVFVFALNPSEQYWGNVIDAAQILRGSDDIDLTQTGHPLLASLGKQGRDFFDFLSEIEMETPVYETADSGGQTLLHRLQNDIQTLSMPSENVSACPDGEALLADGSIRVVSAHSPLRELQILKDQLLHILHEHPDWQPHDIAVLTPNIEPYSPFIEAVFGQAQGGAQALPYSVSDVKLSRRQPLFYALEQVLDLLESRFEVDKVLPLLDSHLVQNRFEWNHDDLPLLYDTIAELNIHWGLDDTMRGAADNLFTWQQAISRMVLGWMLPEGGEGMWQNVSAWHSDVNQLAVFSRFAAFVQTLANIAQEWQTAATVNEWITRIRSLLERLFAVGDDDQYAAQAFEQALAKWQQEADLAGFSDGLLPQHTVIRHISRFLSSESQAGFLRGGITFCSMVPMRSLPFKVLCLLGLNDGDFPRNTKAAVFDLIARHPKKGDRARRDDDRYLFLEAIISAREILYLSYVGRSIRNDDELAPSALLSELIDTVAAMTGRRSKDLQADWVRQHPLQAFSHRYFGAEHLSDGLKLISTRQDYAESLNHKAADGDTDAAFFRRPLEDEESVQRMVTQNEFIGFWKNPVKAWLRQTLGWREPYRDEAWESAEPFEPQEGEKISAAYLEARRRRQDFAAVAVKLEAESRLPSGVLGNLWQQRFQAAAKQIEQDLLESPKIPPVAYELALGKQILSGSLNQVYRRGQIMFRPHTPNAPDEIAILLEHVLFNAVRPSESESGETYLVLNDQTVVYPEIAPDTACDMLQVWLDYYNLGQARPLPFFAKTSLAAARAYAKKQDWEAARSAASAAYHGNKVSKGQGSYTDVALVFGKDETPPLETPLFANLVLDLLVPLLDVTRQNA